MDTAGQNTPRGRSRACASPLNRRFNFPSLCSSSDGFGISFVAESVLGGGGGMQEPGWSYSYLEYELCIDAPISV